MKILMILTSHDQLGNTGKKTGFWLEEFAAPYFVFTDANASVTLASPLGGQPPIDPTSDEPDSQTVSTDRFKSDPNAQTVLANTVRLSTIEPEKYDAVFYPGGHGPLWDLTDDNDSIRIIESLYSAGKPVAAVCHAPAVLLNAKDDNGDYLVNQRNVTGFSNSEEQGAGLSDVVPFLLENELKIRGGVYSKIDDWQPYSIIDENLVTGQNPASSEKVAENLLTLLKDN